MQYHVSCHGTGPAWVGPYCTRRLRRSPASSRRFQSAVTPVRPLNSPLERQQQEQALSLDRVVDDFGIDSLAELSFHGPDDIRGLAASEAVRSAALVTVPINSTLAVALDDDGGQLTILAPPELPPNVKKAFEVVAGNIRDTPDHQLLILAVLLLWVRKYGSTAWRRYCEELLPPARELSCLLCYSPSELPMLQLPHLVDEASRQHDWARWAHTQWLSSASGVLQRLGLADDLGDTAWALAAVRSRAIEFPVGAVASAARPGPTGAGTGGRAARGGPVVSVLAPVVDLANHSPDLNCVVQLTTDRSRVMLLPRRPIAAGEPLTVDYGFDRSSVDLMADYGFVAAANPHDGDVTLAGADKLPPLELPRLEAAARALQRRWLRLRRAATAAAGVEAQAASQEQDALVLASDDEDDEEEWEEEEGGGKTTRAANIGLMVLVRQCTADVYGDPDASFSGRLRAAVGLLAPRTTPTPGSSFSTPATQRIIAGLWHKLVRHCADSLPTSLEQDRQLLVDIQAGRVSGFGGGVPLSLDPSTPSVRTPPPGGAGAVTPAAAAAAAAKQRTAGKGGKAAATGLAAAVKAAAAKRAAAVKAAGGSAGATEAAPPAMAGARPSRATQAGAEATSTGGTVDGSSSSRSDSGVDSSSSTVIPSGSPVDAVTGGSGEARFQAASGSSAFASGARSSASGRVPGLESRGNGTVAAVNPGLSVSAATAQPAATMVAQPDDASRDGDSGEARRLGGSASGGSSAAAALAGLCRTGRLGGRLYAAVRARLEHKLLLAVAEELLVQYGKY